MSKTRKERNAEYYKKFKADPELRRIHNEKNKASYHAHKAERRVKRVRIWREGALKNLGMTEADYWKMRAEQGDVCPACQKPLEGVDGVGAVIMHLTQKRL